MQKYQRSKEQSRFFKILNDAADRRDAVDSAFQYDGLDDDHSPYGRQDFYSELRNIETIPERTATAPFLTHPDKESTEFILVVSELLSTEPKLIDVLAKNNMKLSSKLIPDPEADKPFRNDSSDAWEKAVKSYIEKKDKQLSQLRQAAKSRQSGKV